MDELLQRSIKAKQAICQIRNKQARGDLMKMLRTIDKSMVEVDIESVECRRLHKETLRYKELLVQTQALLANLEQHITFAALLKG